MTEENPQNVFEALKPIVPGLIAFALASVLVRIYD